jgi:tetratricopeptide (TPR) repeat protein
MLVFDPLYLYLGRMPRPGARQISGIGVTVRLVVFFIGMTLLAAGPWIPAAWTEWQIMRARNTALQLQSAGNYSGAVPIWDNLLALHPNDPDVLRQQGLANVQLQNWEAAIRDYIALDHVGGLNLSD